MCFSTTSPAATGSSGAGGGSTPRGITGGAAGTGGGTIKKPVVFPTFDNGSHSSNGSGGTRPGTGGPMPPYHPGTPAPATPKTLQEQILAQEAARQAAIRLGNTKIDTAFGQFNDPYYAGYEKSYRDYYNPQVDSQYNDAQGTTEAGLARNGTDRSSIAATKFGQLFGAYSDERAKIGGDAHDGAMSLRGKVNDAKNNLYTLNAASADPAQANTQALAASTALVTPPAYGPLGSLFSSFLAPYTAYSNSYSNNAGPGYKPAPAPGRP